MAGRKTDDAYAREAIYKIIEALRLLVSMPSEEITEKFTRALDEAEVIADKIDAPLRKKKEG